MSKPDTLDNQSSLCDDEGPIPEFPALAVDSSSGRILPISEEQRAARREAAIRALRAISEITDETDVLPHHRMLPRIAPLGATKCPAFWPFGSTRPSLRDHNFAKVGELELDKRQARSNAGFPGNHHA